MTKIKQLHLACQMIQRQTEGLRDVPFTLRSQRLALTTGICAKEKSGVVWSFRVCVRFFLGYHGPRQIRTPVAADS